MVPLRGESAAEHRRISAANDELKALDGRDCRPRRADPEARGDARPAAGAYAEQRRMLDPVRAERDVWLILACLAWPSIVAGAPPYRAVRSTRSRPLRAVVAYMDGPDANLVDLRLKLAADCRA